LTDIRKVLNRPLTFAEKVLYTHLRDKPVKEFQRGKDYVDLYAYRIALQDATAQIKEAVKTENYPDIISSALIGRCTNYSYRDIDGSAIVAKLAHLVLALSKFVRE